MRPKFLNHFHRRYLAIGDAILLKDGVAESQREEAVVVPPRELENDPVGALVGRPLALVYLHLLR